MIVLLGSLPLIVVSGLLGLRVSPLPAALTGIVTALVLISTTFHEGTEQILPGVVQWLPTAVEVMIIIGGGIALARIMSLSGAQDVLAQWLGRLTGSSVATTLLVVHGVTPFSESVTGFGVGVLVGVPLLRAAGFSPHRAAVLGLLGLCAVPWGALGPGNIVAGRLIGATPEAMGIATAWPNTVVTVGVGVASVLLIPQGRTVRAALAAVASGLTLAAAILLSNMFVAMAPSGALGGLSVIGAHLLWRRLVYSSRVQVPVRVRRVLVPYGLLLGGILAGTAVTEAFDTPAPWPALASPALWLVLTCIVAVPWLRLDRETLRPLLTEVRHRWVETALPTAAFLGLGILMVLGGLTEPIGEAIQSTGLLALLLGPVVGAFGGFITGSSTASNSMFAAAQAAVADGIGVPDIAFVGVQNSASALLTMASPPRVLLAVQTARGGALSSDQATLPRVTRAVLTIDIVLVLALSAWNLALL